MRQVAQFGLLLLFSLSACKTVGVIKKMKSKSVPVKHWTNKKKYVVFLPMVHVGTPEFFADAKRLVQLYKSQGYVVLYEGSTKEKAPLDSTVLDTYRRKLRKMLGFNMDLGVKSYAAMLPQNALFQELIDEPPPHKLGADSTDQSVDLTPGELVDVYEKRFGTIVLSETDRSLPFKRSLPYDRSIKLPSENVNTILIDFRDNLIASRIHSSADKNIVVLYGSGHMKGTLQHLKQLDPTWRKGKPKRE